MISVSLSEIEQIWRDEAAALPVPVAFLLVPVPQAMVLWHTGWKVILSLSLLAPHDLRKSITASKF